MIFYKSWGKYQKNDLKIKVKIKTSNNKNKYRYKIMITNENYK